ncbi:competence protein CoiA family protein [Streptomyces albogriseolus]|uniref:competence protein CoiA family protein n=1 Tax=Streptomyces albogriseolus TaxID=1887 RepID=UPI00224DD774|nr:competence protein CoiA family protein [Streptomyces viridodiastaticus]MCX4623629.1 competence protein CoiA family protein [Streptomyces viridodiastaticus]
MTPAILGFDEEDTRKVQTAVRGGPDGDIPVFLPYEKQAANRLRENHGSNAFSCGVLLGGCGKLLTLRACDDKKSHFAHRPPVRCNRTARGESSADHLYIGDALSRWLRKQGQPNVSLQYVQQTNARSDAIEIRFGSKKKRRLIHVQMARRSFKEWQADGERCAASAGKPPTVRMYGPDSQLAPFELEATGHALRFRCETANGTRVVHIGTHLPGHQVEWTTLDQCRLVHAGIVTPWLRETPHGVYPEGAAKPRTPARSATGERKPSPAGGASAPPAVAAGPALPLLPGSVAFTGATLSSEENGRRVYDADAQPVGSNLFRARISLPASAAAPKPHHVYALTERAAVLSGPQGAGPASWWVLRAEGFVRIPAKKATEWEQLKPPAAAVTQGSSSAEEASTARQGKPAPEQATDESLAAPDAAPEGLTGPPDDRLVAELGRILLKTAREGTTITWYELLKQAGTRPQDVSPVRQVHLLTAVDAPHAKTRRPLLSSLITFSRQAQPNDTPPPFFRQVLLGLGWPHWTDAARAADICKEHRRRLHRAHRLLPARHAAPERSPSPSGPPTARAGERPQARLLTLLRHLDETGDELSFLDLYRVLDEADRLVSQIGEPFLASTAKERLHHWRTAFRRHREAPPVHTQENQEEVEPTEAAGTAAREVFDRMADEFRAAREASDLARAKEVRGRMGPVYALRLSPRDREAVTGLMRDFKQWVRDQEPKPLADPPLRDVRTILQNLGRRRGTVATSDLASALAEVDRLCGRLSNPLPEAERKALERWREHLRRRGRGEVSGIAASPADTRTASPEGGAQAAARLPVTALRPLADRIRAVLQDVARTGTTVTWGDLRRRLGGELPYLHPDDQGEILVMVDGDTPADEPLLSALVAGADLLPHGLYRHIRHSLGRERVPDASLEMHWRMDVFRLHQLWRHR